MKIARAIFLSLPSLFVLIASSAATITNLPLASRARLAPPPVQAPEVQRTNFLAAISNQAGRAVSPQRIKLVPGGARAEFGAHKVKFPADVNGGQRFVVTTPDNRTLAFRPRLLAWHNVSTGERWLAAQVTNRVGLVLGTDRVMYTNAFDSIRADLRYRYTRRGLEQDVILRGRPTLPSGVSAENLQLEVWTEWFDSVPSARAAQTIDLRAGSDLTNGAPTSDESITFGSMRIGMGCAFSVPSSDDKIPVAKQWARVQERDWLIETVDYPALKRKLNLLSSSGSKKTSNLALSNEQLIESAGKVTSEKASSGSLLALNDLPETQGVVLDFVILSCVPLPADAVSWWPSGWNIDDVIGGNHGSLGHTATYGAGKVGQGLDFPLTYDEALGPFVWVADHPSLHFSNALTIEAWINPSDLTTWHAIVDKWDFNAGVMQSYTTLLEPGGKIYLLLSSIGYDTEYIVTSNSVPANAWTHVAATYDGSVMKLYLNGVLDAEGAYTSGIFAGTNDLGIGGSIGGSIGGGSASISFPFAGSIDEPTVYNRALSASELGTIYEADIAGKINPICVTPAADITGWWPGDNHAYDIVSSNTASLLNGATYAPAMASHGFSFDGVNDAVTVPDSDAFDVTASQDLTIEAWIKPLANSTTYGVMDIVSKRLVSDPLTVLGYELCLVDGQLTFQISDAPLRSYNWATWGDTTDLRDGGYHHVAVTMDRSSTTGGHLYVDGLPVVEFDPTVMPGALMNAEPLRMGMHAQSGFNGYYKGTIDELSIYHRALTWTEIHDIYAAGSAGKCRADIDNDGMEDWWEMANFGNLDPKPGDDYDGDGINNLSEFQSHSNPNNIKFDVLYASNQLSNRAVSGTYVLRSGVPIQMAVLVDNTNRATASWVSYTPTFTTILPDADGYHTILLGLRNAVGDAPEWVSTRLRLDRVAPTITITNPITGTVTRPILQLQGYANEQVIRITYDVESGTQQLTNQLGFVVDKTFNAAQGAFTTNYFQCYDIPLVAGNNLVTLRAIDLAGNTTVITTNITLDSSIATNPPSMRLLWPQNGMQLTGNKFYVRGTIDDETADVGAYVVDATGTTNRVEAIVERNGMFWIEELDLQDGTNHLLITTTNVAGVSAVTNLAVVKSSATFTIETTPPGNQLYNARGSVSGQVSPGYNVTVNGFSATVSSWGSWVATNVPIYGRGTATFDAVAASTSTPATPSLNASVEIEMPSMIAIVEHHSSQTWHYHRDSPPVPELDILAVDSKDYTAGFYPVVDGDFGLWFQTYSGKYTWDSTHSLYPHNWGTEIWSDTNPNGTVYSFLDSSPPIPPYTPTSESFLIKSVPQAAGSSSDTFGVSYPSYQYIAHYGGSGITHNWDWHEVTDQHAELTLGAPQTYARLYTGGKSGSHRQNLFCINANAIQYGKPIPLYPWYKTPGTNIPPAELTVCGKHPDSQGNVWLLLEDNVEGDATVWAGAVHYGANATVAKYPQIDLDVDSDNENGLERSSHEDEIEEQSPGKWVGINDGDEDSDGIPNFADGYDLFGTPETGGESASFTPMVIELPAGVDINRAKIRFHYAASDPSGVTHNGNLYTPAPGGIRVWTLDGGAFRKKAPINTYVDMEWGRVRAGDYVAPEIIYAATNLYETTLYVEGIKNGNYAITVELDPDGESGFIASDTVVVTVIGVDLDIDSDNNNELKSPDRSAAEDQMEDDDSLPGKVVALNAGDADFDGIPDFADGFNFDGISSNSDDNAGTNHLVPLILEIPEAIDVNTATLTIGYDASDPTTITYTSTTKNWQPGGGHLRVWRKDANQPRNKASANADSNPGDFVAPGTYTLSKLGFSSSLRTVTNYLEAVAVSQTLADQRITVEFHPTGEGDPGITKDAVRVTVMDLELTEPVDEVSDTPVTAMVNSHPSPVFSGTSVNVLSVVPSPDGTRLIGTLAIQGTVTSKVCDMIPGSEGVINQVNLRVNGETAGSIATTVTKTKPDLGSNDSVQSFTRSYPMTAAFATVVQVDVSPGQNIFQLEARDKVPNIGIAGYIEFSNVVEVLPDVVSAAMPGQASLAGESSFSGFRFIPSPTEVLTKSIGGEFHPYLLHLVGPSELFEKLRRLPGAKIFLGPNQKYYRSDNNSRPDPEIIVVKAGLRTITDPHDPSYYPCFVKGFFLQPADAVRDLIKLQITINEATQDAFIVPVVVNVSGYFGYRVPEAEQRILKFNGEATQLTAAVLDAAIFVQNVQNASWGTLNSFALMDVEGVYKQSAPLRKLCQSAIEVTYELSLEYVNDTPCQRAEIQGRVMFEILMLVIPEAEISKVTVFTKLKAVPWIAANPRILAAIERAILAFERLPEFCFVAGTPVHTDHGLKPIEQIRAGDLVLARDPVTGQQSYKPVLITVVTHPDRLYHLTYRARHPRSSNHSNDETSEGDDYDLSLETTSCSGPHLFYVASKGKFIPARDLQIGDTFLLADGSEAEVTDTQSEDAGSNQLFTTYNFEVADFHTYFVGADGIWVHNAGLPNDFCDALRTAFAINKKTGAKNLAAYEDAALRLAGRSSDGHLAAATKKLSDFIYKEFLDGNIPLDELPTHSWYKRFLTSKKQRLGGLEIETLTRGAYENDSAVELLRFGTKSDGTQIVPGMGPFESHHIPPKYVQKKLQKCLGKTWNLDDVPAMLETRPDHWYPEGLHKFIGDSGIPPNQMNNFPDTPAGARAILDRLEQAYRNVDDPPRPDLVKAIQEWRKTIE